MRKQLTVVAVAVLIGVFASPYELAALEVKTRGRETALTTRQREEVYNAIAAHDPRMTPFQAAMAYSQMIAIGPHDGDTEHVVTVREDNVGELYPCVPVVIVGAAATGGFAEVRKGSAVWDFDSAMQLSYGSVAFFHGAPSQTEALVLDLRVSSTPAIPGELPRDILEINTRGRGTSLTTGQLEEAHNAIVAHDPGMTPFQAAMALRQTIAIDPRDGDTEHVVTVREGNVGELVPCVPVVIVGAAATGGSADVRKGFAAWELVSVKPLTYGSMLIFHGTPSTTEPLIMFLTANFR